MDSKTVFLLFVLIAFDAALGLPVRSQSGSLFDFIKIREIRQVASSNSHGLAGQGHGNPHAGNHHPAASAVAQAVSSQGSAVHAGTDDREQTVSSHASGVNAESSHVGKDDREQTVGSQASAVDESSSLVSKDGESSSSSSSSRSSSSSSSTSSLFSVYRTSAQSHHLVHLHRTVFLYLDLYHSIWDYLVHTMADSEGLISASDPTIHNTNRGSKSKGKGKGLLIAFGRNSYHIQLSLEDFNVTMAMQLVFSMSEHAQHEEEHELKSVWKNIVSQFPQLDVSPIIVNRSLFDTEDEPASEMDPEILRHLAMDQMTQSQKEWLLHMLGNIMQSLRNRAAGQPTGDNPGVADICCVVG